MATCAAAGIAASRITSAAAASSAAAAATAAVAGVVGGGLSAWVLFMELLPVLGLAGCVAACLLLVRSCRSTVEQLTFVDYVHADRN